MEVDDLAAQLFRRPPFLRRLKICRNVKHNQFRHHILLTGDPRRLAAFFRSHRKNLNFLQSYQPVPSLYLLVRQAECYLQKHGNTQRVVCGQA